MTGLRLVISGGQTGVDQAALTAARHAGIKTGGWMPKGFRTEDGPRPDLAQLYGLTEHRSPDYRNRTIQNLLDADATLLLGNIKSPGCRLTRNMCVAYDKPWHHAERGLTSLVADDVLGWLCDIRPGVLNVAGNRESKQPGIYDWAHAVLLIVFARTKERR